VFKLRSHSSDPLSLESRASPVVWYFIASGLGDPAFNMGLDEALLESVSNWRVPVLRFYGWKEPAASFGYFQRFHDVEQLTPLRPLVRRPTGGGIVPHDADWTYSVAFPPNHEWYGLTATDSYRRVHEWIQKAFAKLGLQTGLAPVSVKTQPGRCFVGHEQSDLLWNDRKIAGAAQRRRKDGLLIQGSVQPPSNSLVRSEWELAMRETVGWLEAMSWRECPDCSQVIVRATELAQAKYSRASYNEQR
jgi:lipoate-protein ligase A